VVYRDRTDAFTVKSIDFAQGSQAVDAELSALTAGGGGDVPEAPDAAFQAANQLTWRSGNDVAKVVFWVADAPHHAHNAEAFAGEIRGLRDNGVHVYPIASSGIDRFAEMTMRETAQITNGRYIFLTDDSGVGNSHLEPTDAEVLRTGGNHAPKGRCQIQRPVVCETSAY